MDTEGQHSPAPRPARDTGRPPAELLITLVAEAGAASVVRDRVRSWLTGWWWPDRDLDDIVLAVNEAVANVIDHAYLAQPFPGDVTVFAWLINGSDGRKAGISVIDRGRWRPIPHDPGNRGRGLMMMRACTGLLHIEHSEAGTAATMLSNPVPLDARAPDRL
jgi:anti-sigma regulatory factor (Ser/Thr protein kinase)